MKWLRNRQTLKFILESPILIDLSFGLFYWVERHFRTTSLRGTKQSHHKSIKLCKWETQDIASLQKMEKAVDSSITSYTKTALSLRGTKQSRHKSIKLCKWETQDIASLQKMEKAINSGITSHTKTALSLRNEAISSHKYSTMQVGLPRYARNDKVRFV